MDFDGSRGNVRGRYEAMENVRRNDALAKRERAEASAIRNQLEKQGSIGERSNRLGTLAALAMVDSIAQRSLPRTLGALRKMAQDDARNDRIGPDLRDRVVVGDADGSMDADARTRGDKWSGQGVHPVEPEWLTIEQMRSIAAAKAMASRYW